MDYIIDLENFGFKYKSQAEANLKNINLKVKKGEKILIAGPSGSGKSTLAKAINGQIPNTFSGSMLGKIIVNGKRVDQATIFDLSLAVGTVLQDTDGQFVGLSVGEDIAFSLENDNVSREKMLDEVRAWAERLNILNLLDKKPRDLSGGQKQVVAIAGVLVSDVPILLLDEPLASLDPRAGRDVMKLVKGLCEDLGYTLLVIEHRLEEALLLEPDRIILMDEGEIIFDSEPKDLLRTDLLRKVGIRNPLYLDALAYGGVDLEKFPDLSSLDKLSLAREDLEKIERRVGQIKPTKRSESKEVILDVKNMSFSYEGRKVLDNISFNLKKGELVSVVGPNGAGKSTLAKLLCGFLRPDEGEIWLGDIESKTLSIKEIAEKIGFVLQNPNSMLSKTMIYDEVALGLRLRGEDEKVIRKKVEEVLDICGLRAYKSWPISALSYGQRRRVSIAAILVLDPELIILDEPTAGQDFYHYSQMMEFIENLRDTLQISILMISHDMHLIQEYTERSLVVVDGKILRDTSPAELFSDKTLLEKAHLAETSLYKLGERLPQTSAKDFIEKFIAYERGQRIEK